MERTISMKTLKSSTAKPNGKTPPGDKVLAIETAIRFCEVEDGHNTEDGEEVKILVIQDSRLTSSKIFFINEFPIYQYVRS